MTDRPSTSKLRALHGTAFILLTALVWSIAPVRRWPWIWLVPLAVYFVAVLCIPRLRRSFNWLHVGELSRRNIFITLLSTVLTVLILVLFHITVHPDVRTFRTTMPFDAMGSVVMAGVVFVFANATLEELIFRGLLYDAVQAEWGIRNTLIGTALLFGVGHLHGYPPGNWGVALAILFGFLTGLLRLWTGGLALPILAHIGADTTIYCLVMN